MPRVLSDFLAEGDDLDDLLAGLTTGEWRLPTPAPGWTIAHQVAHLASVFRMAAMSASAPDQFTAMAASLGDDFDANVARALAEYLADPPERMLRRWRAYRLASAEALNTGPLDRIVPWLVRPMPAEFLAAAGVMEVFAHGQDVADAVGLRREYTDRIVHLVEFAIRNRDFGFQLRGLAVPEEPFRFELVGPSGALWSYGPEGAAQRVTGSAVDFCLLTTRRRHRDDLEVTAVGKDADRWLDVAQAYRGPSGEGRRPGQFTGAYGSGVAGQRAAE
ncbi:TIGR03084 family metal-binding protein [Amycolatopsis sp. QT-25]|uniref:TIGR03084 family metal-binding protein n=1 Tax=Amycolatopsis sp. QT-25 TaxID=3034022 RepID=UPI0023EC6E54|nr:TIGR03084 family metal-binding protein [Amycolatopsis sp. QT-25]WET83231.1 TIGR03084 family metal-binding protein [Amycolatopsis sp. QT-25]